MIYYKSNNISRDFCPWKKRANSKTCCRREFSQAVDQEILLDFALFEDSKIMAEVCLEAENFTV